MALLAFPKSISIEHDCKGRIVTATFRNSSYEREELDKYYTEPCYTELLLPYIPSRVFNILEPAAGRGDMSDVLKARGYKVFPCDIKPDATDVEQKNFFATDSGFITDNYIDAIISNPPFGKNAEAFVRHALALRVGYVAMLLRADFNHSVRRRDLFENPDYVGELVICGRRPRWDWWKTKKEGEKQGPSPQHNFSWHIWDTSSKHKKVLGGWHRYVSVTDIK